ncbi:uncharacterized protein LOC129883750 [Solanum dulcamara]|uniref:uncharacterized protein LOC129883750 n=1 Tax=Solanum dulcamara TaxID=45834 RepID=UPI0024865618|nr:uncharacterized protein LOC129883750 [Solanum dulcamara]
MSEVLERRGKSFDGGRVGNCGGGKMVASGLGLGLPHWWSQVRNPLPMKARGFPSWTSSSYWVCLVWVTSPVWFYPLRIQRVAAEENLIILNSNENRSQLHAINAEYITYLKMEDAILRQKTQLHWFKEGDMNSSDAEIADAACEHFQQFFTGEEKYIEQQALHFIPAMVTDKDNEELQAMPTMEEVKTVVFSMNPNSAAGPDGMNGTFFQEIIHQIKKPNVGGNVVIKLDMAKAYDRGDPLSPALFILGAEVLSRLMNNLHHHPQFHGFYMAKHGPQINHLSFADDIIIFSSGRKQTLNLIMDTLATYERISGQLINKHKSHFMIPSNAFKSTVLRIKRIRGFNQKNSPITYLGCPIYIGRQRVIYYSDLISKIVNRITGWQAKILSYGGRVVLVKHVIQAMPIHLLSASTPLSTTIKQIQSITANFFWGWKNDKRKYHWSSWKNLSYPYDEGGIGVRQITDMAKSFQYKQWWVLRTKNTLWGEFLKAKYCQRANLITKNGTLSGSCLFWWDNWLGVGPLAHFSANSTQVSAFMINGQWNAELIIQEAPPQLVPTILATHINYQPLKQDHPCWIPSSTGEFSCSSAWELIRDKRTKTILNSYTWHKPIPFKCSFLVWRTLRGKLPTNEKLTSFGKAPSQCYCCYRPGQDTIDHIFVAGAFAQSIWRLFADSLGINKEYTPLRNLLMRWWTSKHKNKAHKLILHATHIFICWNLWKNRCASKYGGKQSNLARVKFSIFKDTSNLLNTAFPYIDWPNNWRDLVLLTEQCYHDTKITPVCWTKPTEH